MTDMRELTLTSNTGLTGTLPPQAMTAIERVSLIISGNFGLRGTWSAFAAVERFYFAFVPELTDTLPSQSMECYDWLP
jgi:hypothetical protein